MKKIIFSTMFLLILSMSLAYAPEIMNRPLRVRDNGLAEEVIHNTVANPVVVYDGPMTGNKEIMDRPPRVRNNGLARLVPDHCVKFSNDKLERCIDNYEMTLSKKTYKPTLSNAKCRSISCYFKRWNR